MNSLNTKSYTAATCIFCHQGTIITGKPFLSPKNTYPTHIPKDKKAEDLNRDCGSDHELLIAKFRLKLKKIGKTTRTFRYNLHQIPYDYTVEVRNRFKGLDLIDRVHEVIWTEVVTLYRRARSRPSPRKRNVKSNMVV